MNMEQAPSSTDLAPVVARPVTEARRVRAIDMLRGVALLLRLRIQSIRRAAILSNLPRRGSDLDTPVVGEPAMAAALPFRTLRVVVAQPDLLAHSIDEAQTRTSHGDMRRVLVRGRATSGSWNLANLGTVHLFSYRLLPFMEAWANEKRRLSPILDFAEEAYF